MSGSKEDSVAREGEREPGRASDVRLVHAQVHVGEGSALFAATSLDGAIPVPQCLRGGFLSRSGWTLPTLYDFRFITL